MQYDTVHTTFPRRFRRGFVCRSNRRGTTNYTPRRLAAHGRRTRLLATPPPHGAFPPRKRSPPPPRRRNSQTYGISDNADLSAAVFKALFEHSNNPTRFTPKRQHTEPHTRRYTTATHKEKQSFRTYIAYCLYIHLFRLGFALSRPHRRKSPQKPSKPPAFAPKIRKLCPQNNAENRNSPLIHPVIGGKIATVFVCLATPLSNLFTISSPHSLIPAAFAHSRHIPPRHTCRFPHFRPPSQSLPTIKPAFFAQKPLPSRQTTPATTFSSPHCRPANTLFTLPHLNKKAHR